MNPRVPRSRVTHDRWLVSYADFITLLFGLFVVMFAFAQGRPEEAGAGFEGDRHRLPFHGRLLGCRE